MGSETQELVLPEDFQLSVIEEIHASYSSQISNVMTLDGSNVSKVDTAALQLLVSLKKELDQAAGRLEWKAISPPLAQAINSLGLSEILATEH